MKIKDKSLLIMVICVALIGLANTFFYNEDRLTVHASSTGTITASSLNVREGAGTTYDILLNNGVNVSIKKGTLVTVLKEEKGWYFISFEYNGQTIKGYVLATYVSVNVQPSPQITPDQTKVDTLTEETLVKVSGKVTTAKLNVRVKPSTKANKLTVKGTTVSVVKSQTVNVLSEKIVSGDKWYYISFTNKGKVRKGYVLSNYVTLNLSKTVKAKVKSSSAVKMQTAAGKGKSYLKVGSKVVSVKNEKLILITKEVTVSGIKWFQISFVYDGSRIKGYILASKVAFRTETKPPIVQTGTVSANSLKVRVDAGVDKEEYIYNEEGVKLVKNQKVTILSSKVVDNVIWYQVSFTIENTTLSGYVSGEYIVIDDNSTSPTPTPSPTPKPSTSPVPSVSPAPTVSPIPSPTVSPLPNEQPLSDIEFEQSLVTQGFPESYKPYLRTLHQQYPYWQFQGLQTGLDWNTVITAENAVGKNLISNYKTIAWKSLESKAYNWETDKFIAYDGSSWVTASKQALEYYMDPRNFLTSRSIFQFESLEYRTEYQKQPGVEKILLSTPMFNTKYAFTDLVTGQGVEYSYSETFIKAAEYSGVSPYHLASRVKQEVVTGPTSMSSSVSGTVSGYEGYYNFYNIGAFHSTAAGGAIANGLKFAMNGTTSATNNALFLIPWNSPYRAILGGAKFIGNNYINKGQNTGYLQKFNVTSYSRYNHQYMANVEAANAEAAKTFNAYSSISDVPIVFSIPVYLNMPFTPSPVPSGGSNPNNWLKNLTVSNYALTPTFKISDAGNMEYTVIVENAVTSIDLSAIPVSTTATVSGTGLISLVEGNNKAVIQVVAQNGDIKNYTVNIIRNTAIN